ncbi:MAG: hypothetical protein ACJAV7_002463, partial [Flavobacteriales bacterium]
MYPITNPIAPSSTKNTKFYYLISKMYFPTP